MVAGELLGLGSDGAREFPVLVLLAIVAGGGDPEDVVGLGVGLAATGREGYPPDKLPDLGGDDDPVSYPEV